MNDQMAKMAVLKQIMDLMTSHQLGGLKKKGEKPDVAMLAVKADGPESLPPDAGKGEDGHAAPDADDDPEMLKMLLDNSDDDDKKSDPSC